MVSGLFRSFVSTGVRFLCDRLWERLSSRGERTVAPLHDILEHL